MHSDNLQNWIIWRDKLFCDFWLFFTTKIALNANSLTFTWLFPIFIFSLTFNKIPWLLPSLEFPWLFPDHWTPCSSFLRSRWRGKNVPGIPSACPTHNFTYLVRGPWKPDLKMNCRLNLKIRHRDSDPNNGHQGDMPYLSAILLGDLLGCDGERFRIGSWGVIHD